MPTTTSAPGSSTEVKASGQNPRRTDAVGVEISVMVHASRNSVSAREIARPLQPVHEETRTVIVFPQGAVVRLTAAMIVGELVVLTNQRSGADVLCRVASVKTQTGIQNYVDLEFTQRAPGFWGDCFPAEQLPAVPMTEFALPESADSFAPSVNKPSSAPLPPVKVAPPDPVVPAPVSIVPPTPAPIVQAPVSAAPAMTPKPAASAPVIAPAAQSIPPMTFSSLPSMRPEPELPVAVQVPPAAPVSSSGGLSLRSHRAPVEPQPLPRSFESSSQAENTPVDSRKMILIAVAAVVLLSLIGGGVMILHKGSTVPAASQPAVATQSLPAPSAGIPKPSSVVPPQVAAAPAKQEPAPAANAAASLRSEEPVVQTSPNSAPLPKRPSRSAVALTIGKLSAPVSRNPTPTSSSVAPPVLPASVSAAPAGTNGLLLSSDPNSGPVSPATLARNTTLVGGRVLEPKLISSAPPTYPQQATLQRVQGDVVVDALVDAKGRVTEAKAISGSPLLQQAAVNAVRNWKYEPARLDGESVPAHMQVKISFHLP